jgi:hypothetical protein
LTSRRKTTRRNWQGGHYDFMRRVLASERGGALYRMRQPMIEPVFAQMKFNRGPDRFRRRGRAAVRTEWRPITATQPPQAPPARHSGRLSGRGRRPPPRRRNPIPSKPSFAGTASDIRDSQA